MFARLLFLECESWTKLKSHGNSSNWSGVGVPNGYATSGSNSLKAKAEWNSKSHGNSSDQSSVELSNSSTTRLPVYNSLEAKSLMVSFNPSTVQENIKSHISYRHNVASCSAPSIRCKAKLSSNKIFVSCKAKIKELHILQKVAPSPSPTVKRPNMNNFATSVVHLWRQKGSLRQCSNKVFWSPNWR
jgi:hypothetical protein